MDRLIPSLYYAYGRYVTEKKMLPNFIDGSIPVWKRLLLSCHMIARNEFVKTTEVTAHCMGNYHPFSDSFGVAETLVQCGLMDGKGNWGCNLGIEAIGAAAPRYTGLKANPFIEELCFKYVDDVEWKPDEAKPEPTYLPTMLPICLCSKYEFNMIAFGFKTVIPNYTIKDLIKRLLYLLKEGPKIIIKPNIEFCKILSPESECEKLLTTVGKQNIDISGNYTEDRKNFIIYVNGWSPRMTFQNVFNKIDNMKDKKEVYKLFSNGDVSYIDESNDRDGTKIRLEVSKARNREKIYDKLLHAVKECLTNSIYYDIYVFDPNIQSVRQTCIDEMLLSSYNHYLSVLEVHLKNRMSFIEDTIRGMKLIEKIRPYISSLTNDSKKIEDILQILSEKTNESVEDISQIVTKYRIRKLLTINVDIDELEIEKKDIEEKLKDVPKFSINNYKEILKNLK